MIRPPDALKASCTRAAEALAAEDRRGRLRAILEEHGLAGGSPVAPGQPGAPAARVPSADSVEDRVGIWRAREVDGQRWFVRERCDEVRFWADVDRIPPKSARPRVVLIGESAARGFFYDPHFAFAAVIEQMLASANAADVEVVDVARTDLTLAGLTALLPRSAALEPDALIVFAGNNWLLTQDPPNFSMEGLAAILRAGGGAPELRAHCEELLRQQARSVIRSIASLSAARSMPAILVVPEFNLADWQTAMADHTPFRSSGETAMWFAARDEAMRALDSGDVRELARAEAAALRMIALDSGTTPDGYALLGACARRRAQPESARAWLELARDAVLFLPVMRSPRCYGVVQDVLRREAVAHGIALVDLPEIFAEALGGELPDRRLFLDYCHLTLDGMRIAGASIVERLLPLIGRRTPPRGELAQTVIDVPAEVQAEARVRAAIHNAHWGQSREIVELHCREAVRLAPAIGGTMLRFVDASLRRAPSFICASMERVARESGYQDAASLHLFNSLPPLRKNLNLDLIDAAASALRPLVPRLRDTIDRLLVSEHCAGSAPCDLLQRAYCSTSLADWDLLNTTIFYRALQRRSAFTLISCRSAPFALTLTARGHAANRETDGAARAVLFVNGEEAATLPLSSRWTTHHVDVPAAMLREGVNTLAIEWPRPELTREDRLVEIGRALQRERVPNPALVYAEVSRFTATAGGACSHAPMYWPEVAALLPDEFELHQVAYTKRGTP